MSALGLGPLPAWQSYYGTTTPSDTEPSAKGVQPPLIEGADPEYQARMEDPTINPFKEDADAFQLGPNAGSPLYLQEAFSEQRAGLADAIALATRGTATKVAPGSTNAAGLSPRDIGMEIARASSQSRLTQDLSQVEQTMNLLGMGAGGAGSTGSASLAAAGNQIQAASMMPKWSTGANVLLGALATGAAGYEGYQGYQTAQKQRFFDSLSKSTTNFTW
jgi:hypothetical protein